MDAGQITRRFLVPLAMLTLCYALDVLDAGVKFEESALTFKNCSVQIEACILRSQLKRSATFFKAGGISTNVSLVIRNSTFVNNSLAISADFHNNVGTLGVTIDLQNTRFTGNGLVTDPAGPAGILLWNSSKTEGVLRVRVNCSNISYVENHGSFMKIELATAITKESYIDVTLLRNGIPRLSRESHSRRVPRSLYYVLTIASGIIFESVRRMSLDEPSTN